MASELALDAGGPAGFVHGSVEFPSVEFGSYFTSSIVVRPSATAKG